MSLCNPLPRCGVFNRYVYLYCFFCFFLALGGTTAPTARSREYETRNGHRNANRNFEWWGHLSQLQIQIKPKFEFEFLSRNTEEFKFNQILNLNLYRETPRNLTFPILTC